MGLFYRCIFSFTLIRSTEFPRLVVRCRWARHQVNLTSLCVFSFSLYCSIRPAEYHGVHRLSLTDSDYGVGPPASTPEWEFQFLLDSLPCLSVRFVFSLPMMVGKSNQLVELELLCVYIWAHHLHHHHHQEHVLPKNVRHIRNLTVGAF